MQVQKVWIGRICHVRKCILLECAIGEIKKPIYTIPVKNNYKICTLKLFFGLLN